MRSRAQAGFSLERLGVAGRSSASLRAFVADSGTFPLVLIVLFPRILAYRCAAHGFLRILPIMVNSEQPARAATRAWRGAAYAWGALCYNIKIAVLVWSVSYTRSGDRLEFRVNMGFW